MAGINKDTKDTVMKLVQGVMKDVQGLAGDIERSTSDAMKKVAENNPPLAGAMKDTREAVSKVAKETASTARKTAQKAAEAKKKAFSPTVKEYIQYRGKEISHDDIMEMVIASYVAGGKSQSSIREIQLYIKPEDNVAYYVINGEDTGKVYLM